MEKKSMAINIEGRFSDKKKRANETEYPKNDITITRFLPAVSARAPEGISNRKTDNSRNAISRPISVKVSPFSKQYRIKNGSKYR
jgi:hypothetical protein